MTTPFEPTPSEIFTNYEEANGDDISVLLVYRGDPNDFATIGMLYGHAADYALSVINRVEKLEAYYAAAELYLRRLQQTAKGQVVRDLDEASSALTQAGAALRPEEQGGE